MSLKVKLDDTEYIDHTENHFISKSTISKKHPAHVYSNPGQLHINIPKGIIHGDLFPDNVLFN